MVTVARSVSIASRTVCRSQSSRGIPFRACRGYDAHQAAVGDDRERSVVIAVDKVLHPMMQVERRRNDDRGWGS